MSFSHRTSRHGRTSSPWPGDPGAGGFWQRAAGAGGFWQRAAGAGGCWQLQRPAAGLVRRRPLQLLIATGAATAGLCLIFGLLAVAITAGRPAAVQLAGRASPASDRGPGATGGTSGLVWFGPGRTVAILRGTGARRAMVFRFLTPSGWGLAWAYSCARTGRRGSFRVGGVLPAAAPSRAVAVDAAGWSGYGTAWGTGNAGHLVLAVTSGCRWTIRVVAAPVPAGHR